MSFSRYLTTTALAAVCAATLAACSSAKTDDYKNARALPPLEVPPDLINPPKDTALAVPAVAAAPAAAAADAAAPAPASAAAPAATAGGPAAHLERDGAQRWLVVPGTVATVLPRVREFLLQEGYEVAREDAARGTLETEWRAAEAAGGGEQPRLNTALAESLQDKFRLRIEPGRAAGTVELRVGHLGLQRVAAGGEPDWQPRPADPLLEAELLDRMQNYFADEAAPVEPSPDLPTVKAEINTSTDGVATMRLAEGYDRAWRRIGFALGRGGFVIEDRNRDEGVYLIRLGRAFKEDAKAGFFSRLFGANAGDPDARFRVALKDRGDETTVVVQHPGGAPVRTSIGERILDRLKEKME